MKTSLIKIEKPSKEDLLAFRRSSQKMSELLKAHGISEEDIITEFNALRKQAKSKRS
ncbi:MAG: hypothetical protein ACOYN8_01310 [Pseudanabaena sp.]|jgi:hypothetical protein